MVIDTVKVTGDTGWATSYHLEGNPSEGFKRTFDGTATAQDEAEDAWNLRDGKWYMANECSGQVTEPAVAIPASPPQPTLSPVPSSLDNLGAPNGECDRVEPMLIDWIMSRPAGTINDLRLPSAYSLIGGFLTALPGRGTLRSEVGTCATTAPCSDTPTKH